MNLGSYLKAGNNNLKSLINSEEGARLENIEELAVTIRDAVRDLPKRYNEGGQRIKEIEDEIADYMHLIEFTKFNAYEGFQISKQLQQLRIERRRLKK